MITFCVIMWFYCSCLFVSLDVREAWVQSTSWRSSSDLLREHRLDIQMKRCWRKRPRSCSAAWNLEKKTTARKFMLLPLCVHAVREASWAETDQMWSEPRSGRGQRCRAVAGWGCTFTEPYTNFIQSRGRSSSKNTNASHVVFLQQQQLTGVSDPQPTLISVFQ